MSHEVGEEMPAIFFLSPFFLFSFFFFTMWSHEHSVNLQLIGVCYSPLIGSFAPQQHSGLRCKRMQLEERLPQTDSRQHLMQISRSRAVYKHNVLL